MNKIMLLIDLWLQFLYVAWYSIHCAYCAEKKRLETMDMENEHSIQIKLLSTSLWC